MSANPIRLRPPESVSRVSVAQRIRDLQAQARQLGRDHIKGLVSEIMRVESTAAEIAEGGDAYPPGVRDLARRLVEDCEARIQTIEAIVARCG